MGTGTAPTTRPNARALRTAVLAFAALTGAACSPKDLPELPQAPVIAEPDPDAVEYVVYLLGDPGETRRRFHPIVRKMERDIAEWTGALDRDSAVVVLILGDVVYPDGVHPIDDPQHAEDSTIVSIQVGLVRQPGVTGRAVQYFMAGNHDWGNEEDFEGAVRLGNLATLLDEFRAEGVPVSLVPEPGTGGPEVVDVGESLRLLLIDSAWWLMDAENDERDAFLGSMGDAFASAGERAVVVAAHHPWASAGSHGGARPIWSFLGAASVLRRSGAILQDLNSRPYRRLRAGMRAIADEHGPPLLFAGGHDHSLQLIEGVRDDDPTYSLVAGSASKITSVGHLEGLLVRRAEPGYARLFVLRDGGLVLSLEAAPAEFLECEPGDGREACLERGVAAYRTVWRDRIR
jgi:hypothetical protein